MPKVIAKFDPVTNRTFEEAEAHYVEVHTQFARKMFRDHAPSVERYVINRATHQYSVNGHFDQKPRAWRWVISHLTSDDFMPEQFLPAIWRDHTNCLRNARTCMVEEEIVTSRLNMQTSTTKFLIEHDLEPGQSPQDARAYYADVYLPKLTELLQDALGFRLLVSNRVETEAEAVPFEEEGQVLTGEYNESDKIAFDEIWFDNREWGDAAFTQQGVYDLLQLGELATSAYLIDEDTGIDRR